MIDFVKNKLSQSYLKKQRIKDIDNVESKIYELLYSKKEMKFVDINSYFNMDDKQLNLILEDLISKNIIECINDSYKLKSE